MAKKKAGKAALIAAVALGLAGTVVMGGALAKLSQDVTTKDVGGWTKYEIGILDEAGAEASGKTAIRMKKYVTTDGLTVDIKKDATVTYSLYFYDEDKTFMSALTAQTTDFSESSIPEGAEYVKVVVTPNEDEKVTWNEIGKYEKQITVIVDK